MVRLRICFKLPKRRCSVKTCTVVKEKIHRGQLSTRASATKVPNQKLDLIPRPHLLQQDEGRVQSLLMIEGPLRSPLGAFPPWSQPPFLL